MTAVAPALDGEVAPVTGAASGIGPAATKLLRGAGCGLVPGDRDGAALRDAAGGLGERAVAAAADVAQDGSTARAVVRAGARFGPVSLAVLDAGLSGPIGRIEDVPPAGFDRVVAVNLRGVWLGLAALPPSVRRAGGGSLVATSSTAGLRGAARPAAHSAGKHAVIGLVQSAAPEVARDGVRVNAVCPGPVDTGMMAAIEAGFRPGDPEAARRGTAARVPLGRLGTPEDVAAPVLFLPSDRAGFTAGGAYRLDGGVVAGLAG